MSHALRVGIADQIAFFRAYNTDGSAKTDLTSSTTGLTLSVFRVGAAAVSISSLSAKAADNTAHTDGAIRAVSGNLYTVDLPDAACADQVPSISVKGSYTGGVIEGPEHPLVGYNPASVAVGANTTTPPTVGAIADQVWDEARSGHVTAGTFGEKVNAELDSTRQQALADLAAMITGSGTADAKFDAMALSNAPAASGGLTTEQDELLTSIGQRTAQITGSRLPVAGPVTPGGQINLVVGSDYVDDIDSSLIRTVTDAGETLHDALTAGELTDLVFSAAPKSNSAATKKITGTVAAVSHAGGVTSITIEIARADIPNGPYDEDWKYQIWRTTTDHISPPLLEGQLLLHWRA